TNSLPSTKPQLKHVKLHNPIEQDFSGSGSLFRQQDIEKWRIMSIREWAEQCKREDMRAPTIEEAQEIVEDGFLMTFDPHNDWLLKDMKPGDYTPEFCRMLERMYWRSCGFGKAPWYGADMKGEQCAMIAFTPDTKHWNVTTLPFRLSHLLGSDSQISGINTPYLYFGMWQATFTWDVEDVDLFSINYIHFGAPKFWYAIPQSQASNLETTMKGYFPCDISNCPQFLHHKSFLTSPPKLEPAHPNTLIQHAGKFVVTFPRGYDAGFNLGFNCTDSMNFALESWIKLGKKAGYWASIEDSIKIDIVRVLKEREIEWNGHGVMTDKGSEHARVGACRIRNAR
ncbi:JmjC domain, hydroxylase-domain-containing protein, partial [Hysterangium stoloniferum]